MSYPLEVPVGSTVTAPPHKKQKQITIDDGLVELAEVLESIDENKPSAELNKVSMIDNMGRRIYY